jgi:hypothetical protein
MGWAGGVIGSEIGKVGGREFGAAIGKRVAGRRGQEIGGGIGSTFGRVAGAAVGGFLTPFETGGVVPGRRGAPMPILAHGGEVVLPLNAKVTKAQMKTIQRNKRRFK